MAVDQSLVGRSFPSTAPYAVSEERVAEFAAATGSTYDGGPAPATFPIVVAFRAMRELMDDPSVGIALHRVVHGEQRFVHHRPITAGDEVLGTLTVDTVRQAGGNAMVTTRTELATAVGEALCTSISTIVVRGEE